MLPVLATHFERLYASLAGDLTRIMHRHFSRGLERAWAALTRSAPPTSPLLPQLRHYAAAHAAILCYPGMLTQLADLVPGSDLFKQLALRLVLAEQEDALLTAAQLLARQFITHPDVQALVADIQDPGRETGKIVAAVLGWPKLPQLAALFREQQTHTRHINPHAGYHLRFLFESVPQVADFLAQVHTDPYRLQRYYRFFSEPLLVHICRDEAVQTYLLAEPYRSEHVVV